MKKFIYIMLCFIAAHSVNAQGLHSTAKDLPCLNKNFNVFVHISLDSMGETNISEEFIDSLFIQTNIFFAPICVSFTACKFDTLENYNYGQITDNTTREMLSLFYEQNRINLFLVDNVIDPQNACGFAALGGATNRNLGYIFLEKDCGVTAFAHELGHLFGLLHTFDGDGDELVDGSNGDTTGDLIADTPSDPYDLGDNTSDYVDDTCEFINNELDANGQYYQPDVGNVMSYYTGCACGFTRGQFLKMVEIYESSSFKNW